MVASFFMLLYSVLGILYICLMTFCLSSIGIYNCYSHLFLAEALQSMKVLLKIFHLSYAQRKIFEGSYNSPAITSTSRVFNGVGIVVVNSDGKTTNSSTPVAPRIYSPELYSVITQQL